MADVDNPRGGSVEPGLGMQREIKSAKLESALNASRRRAKRNTPGLGRPTVILVATVTTEVRLTANKTAETKMVQNISLYTNLKDIRPSALTCQSHFERTVR